MFLVVIPQENLFHDTNIIKNTWNISWDIGGPATYYDELRNIFGARFNVSPVPLWIFSFPFGDLLSVSIFLGLFFLESPNWGDVYSPG